LSQGNKSLKHLYGLSYPGLVHCQQENSTFPTSGFEKAFDRVAFVYLWKTLEKLGLSGQFLTLTQGLVLGALAKVFINSLYTPDIPLLQGVRQSDPLAPLLFAIATQPLISYIDAIIEDKTFPAVQINPELSVCHMFFANDVGIFLPATSEAFKALQDCLDIYQKASGAKLNLQKSIIIPMTLETIPPWLAATGCTISQSEVVYRYLGAPFGVQLTFMAIQEFCLERLTQRFSR
jgi:hypothetical protein